MDAKDSTAEKKPIDVYELFPPVAEIKDKTLRAKVVAIWEEMWEISPWSDVNEVPTSTEIPYPTVPHNQCVLAMAIAVADCFEKYHDLKVDRDALIAGAILQDASKVVEFAPNDKGEVVSTEIGKSVPHAFWTAHLAAKHGLSGELLNIILTHTPQAAKFPTTLEGKILFWVDQIDVLGIFKDRWRKELFITK